MFGWVLWVREVSGNIFDLKSPENTRWERVAADRIYPTLDGCESALATEADILYLILMRRGIEPVHRGRTVYYKHDGRLYYHLFYCLGDTEDPRVPKGK